MLSAEFQILLQSVRVDAPEAAARETEKLIRENEINWSDLLARAEIHAIRPLLAELIHRIGGKDIPGEFSSSLDDYYIKNAAFQIENLAEYFRISSLLEHEKITVVPFKGFWLAHSAYSNLSARESGDIDILASKNEILQIRDVLTGNGYRVQESLTRLTEEYIFRELAEYNLEYYKGERKATHLEVHWRIGLRGFRIEARLEDLLDQVEEREIQGRTIKVFTPAANLLLVVLHHGGKDIYLRLKHLADIGCLLNNCRAIDWQWLIKKAERYRVKTLLFLGLRLACDYTGAAVPDKVIAYLQGKRITELAEGRILKMNTPPEKWKAPGAGFHGWPFRISTRDGIGTKLKLTGYAVRKVAMPMMVPESFRHYFFNRKIRLEN
jgi:hypothetical protein